MVNECCLGQLVDGVSPLMFSRKGARKESIHWSIKYGAIATEYVGNAFQVKSSNGGIDHLYHNDFMRSECCM
jgi:hypothetical protein